MDRGLTLFWLLAPLPAVVVGAAVARQSGVSPAVFAPNLAGLLLGGLAAAGVARLAPTRWRRALPWVSAAACLALAATLLGPGMDGVRRWLALGPLRLNASEAFLPWILGAMGLCGAGRWWLVAVVAQGVHLAQPDAAQATALAAGSLVLVGGRPGDRGRQAACAALVVLAAGTWLRADPLPAVDVVERILALAWALGAPWLAAALLAVAPLLAPAVFAAARGGPRARLAAALGGAWVAALASTFLGNFPVPVLGAGAGPVLGWCAGLALLAARPLVADEP